MDMKRSVSPLSGSEPNNPSKKKRLISVFSALKDVFTKSSQQSVDSSSSLAGRAENIASDEEELPNSFVSRKRRMSINENIKRLSLAIPRTSVSGPAGTGMLESIYSSMQSQQENKDVDGEFTRLGSNPEEQLSREISPSVHVPKVRALPKTERESGLEIDNSMVSNLHALILNQDYASLYEDDLGNLVRPTFINLDPKERYQLLQMKKSIEASEFLQSRLKYMVDPDETTSIYKAGNRVDTSTQTHTKDYLHDSLNFTALKTKLALQNRRHRKTKKGLGAFSGEFFYEPSEPSEPAIVDQKFEGVLGSIKKPKFTVKPAIRSEKTFPDADPRQVSLKRRGSVSQRPGLEHALRFGKRQESLDEGFNQKSYATSNDISLNDQVSKLKAATVGPSSAFKFDIPRNKIGSIVKSTIDHEGQAIEEPSAPSEIKPPFFSATKNGEDTRTQNVSLLGSAPSNPFSFDTKSNSMAPAKESGEAVIDKGLGGVIQEKQASMFGSNKDTPPAKSSLSFADSKNAGSVSKPTFSFETPNVDTNVEAKVPPFKFGLTSKSEVKPSTFSFGNGSQQSIPKPSATSNTTSSSAEPPAFSFGKPLKMDEKTSGPTFGSTKTAPTFSFGKSNQERAQASDASNLLAQGKLLGSSKETPMENAQSASSLKPDADTDTTNKGFSRSREENEEPGRKRKVRNETTGLSFGVINGLNSEEKPVTAPGSGLLFGSKPTGSVFERKPDAPRSGNQDDAKPSFGFAFNQKPQQDVTQDSAPPKFSFDKPVALTSEPKAPGHSLEARKETAQFSFGGAKGPTDASASETKDPAQASLPSLKPPDASAFSFGSGPKPVSFGNQTSSSEPTPAPSFQFANPNVSHNASGSSSFNFGQTATADPALIFGGGGSAPAPAFSFSVAPQPVNIGTAGQSTPFGSAQTPAGGFNFSSKATSAFGGSRPATPANPVFGFGANPSNGGQAPAPPFTGFNNATAPSSVFGGPSRSVTPNFGVGQNSQGQPNNGPAQPNGFSFSNTAMNSAAFNSAPGSFGQVSRDITPPAFGNPMPGGAPAPGGMPRRIASMRPRRR